MLVFFSFILEPEFLSVHVHTQTSRHTQTETYTHSLTCAIIYIILFSVFPFLAPSVFIFPCDLLLQQALIVKQKIFLNSFYLLFLQLSCAIIIHFLIKYQLQHQLFGDQNQRYYFEKLRTDMLNSYGHNIKQVPCFHQCLV